jgi:hypothetical protein
MGEDDYGSSSPWLSLCIRPSFTAVSRCECTVEMREYGDNVRLVEGHPFINAAPKSTEAYVGIVQEICSKLVHVEKSLVSVVQTLR